MTGDVLEGRPLGVGTIHKAEAHDVFLLDEPSG
jgi:hypothetical protein